MIDREGGGILEKQRNIAQVADVDIALDRVFVVVVEAIVELIGIGGEANRNDGDNLFQGILSLRERNRSSPMRIISS